jgi:hypothetical protein
MLYELPSHLILSVTKSNIIPSLRLPNNTHHISLYGLVVKLVQRASEDAGWPKLFPNFTHSTMVIECV